MVLLLMLESIGSGVTQPAGIAASQSLPGAHKVSHPATDSKQCGTQVDGEPPVETNQSALSTAAGTHNSVHDHILSTLNKFDLLVEESIQPHQPHVFFKCCETLSYLVRSDLHVTAINFSSCVHCIRTFSEVSSCGLALEHEANSGRLVKCVQHTCS